MTITCPTRRGVLMATAALAVSPRRALSAPMVLRAEPVSAQILPPDKNATKNMLGYNGRTPGPELRVRQGERLDVLFENAIGTNTAVHWHGIRIDNAMDGVPGMTQLPVKDGDRFEYSFVAPDAGTFWYHSHSRSWEQVEQGLYGALIVEERDPPPVDHDITVLIDDWRLTPEGALAGGFGHRHDMSHAGRLGNYGKAIPSLKRVKRGDRVRLRLINAATARIFPIEIAGADAKIVALDGMPLKTPRAPNDLMIAPAQRVDFIADVLEDIRILFPRDDEPYELARIFASGENDNPIGGAIPALPSANVSKPGKIVHDLTVRIEGGAMGGFHEGDDIWALNGHSGLPEEPMIRFNRGETARIKFVNTTAFPHGMHLHGHHFHELDRDGALGDLRDTTLIVADETRDIICGFDNPGKWLLHCHMLEHQAAGMKTWVEVI